MIVNLRYELNVAMCAFRAQGDRWTRLGLAGGFPPTMRGGLLWNNPLALGRLGVNLANFEGLWTVLGCFWAAFGVSWLLGAAIGDSQVTLGSVFGRPLASHDCFWRPLGALD